VLKKTIILLLIGSWTISLAQEPIRYTTKQGLPTNHVYDIAEDENGFMWFATKQGLVKYDGVTFKTFTTQNGLPNNDTWKLETDYNGRIYYFSKSAYQGYIKNDSIYKFSTINKEVLTPASVYKSNNKFWFFANGIKSFKNNQIIDNGLDFTKWNLINTNLIKKYSLNDGKLIRSLCNPVNKEFAYLNIKNKEFYIFDWNFNLKKTFSLNVKELTISSSFIETGLIYNQIGYYAFREGVLFINFKDYSIRFLSFKEIFSKKTIPMYFKLKCLPNEIQISIPGYLALLDYNLKIKENYKFSEVLGSFSYKDSNDNIWLTSISNGVSLISNTKLQSQYNFKDLKVQKINSLDNIFYVGINNKGIYSLNLKTNQEKELIQFDVPHSEIYQIKKDKISNKKTIVVARYTFKIKENEIDKIEINNTENINSFDEFSSGGKDYFSYNNNDYIIISTGINRCGYNDDLSDILVTKQGLLGSEIYNDKAYIYGSDGLFQFKNEKLISFNEKFLNISTNTLFSNKDFLFVGTDGRGLCIYDEKEVYHLKETDGLSIQRIIVKDNYVWLATQKGVFKILLNKDNLEQSKIIDAFYDTDGLLQNNTNDIYIKNNTLYAASDIGLAKINLANPSFKQKPNLYFKTKTDTLQFKNGARDNISISFSSLDFVNQEHLKYSYRLLPLQEKWTETLTKTLNFSNLDPKLYTLEVKVMDQHFNHSIHKLYIDIIPEWWQTVLAKIFFVILFILLFLGLIKIIKTQIRKKEAAKALQDKRIAGLELQALRSQMNPHFVHNSLNAIQYFIQRNEVELSENYLSKFSQLIRLFFEYSRRQTVTIQEEIDLLNNYLELEKLRFEEKLNFTISVCETFDKEEQLIPSMLLQPIVENAVNHGIFHKKENGNISVNFKYIDETSFKVIIQDDGIGINRSKALFKASSKNYQSNSSKVLQERLELLNQSKDWEITYEITDKSDEDYTINGTIVALLFKQKIQE
jgi:two-component sensor histidine kinase